MPASLGRFTEQRKEPMMRSAKIILCSLIIINACATTRRISAQTPSSKRIVIAASTVLDGKGHVLRNTRIVVEG